MLFENFQYFVWICKPGLRQMLNFIGGGGLKKSEISTTRAKNMRQCVVYYKNIGELWLDHVCSRRVVLVGVRRVMN